MASKSGPAAVHQPVFSGRGPRRMNTRPGFLAPATLHDATTGSRPEMRMAMTRRMAALLA